MVLRIVPKGLPRGDKFGQFNTVKLEKKTEIVEETARIYFNMKLGQPKCSNYSLLTDKWSFAKYLTYYQINALCDFPN